MYSPNFKGTDINEFINIVGMNLKKTIIVDPQVRGRINVRSYEMLNEQQYYQFFLNVLEVYSFAVVEMDNGVLKVVRNKDAKTSNIPVVTDDSPGQGDEMVTRVVQVRNVSVRELAPLLRAEGLDDLAALIIAKTGANAALFPVHDGRVAEARLTILPEAILDAVDALRAQSPAAAPAT